MAEGKTERNIAAILLRAAQTYRAGVEDIRRGGVKVAERNVDRLEHSLDEISTIAHRRKLQRPMHARLEAAALAIRSMRKNLKTRAAFAKKDLPGTVEFGR